MPQLGSFQAGSPDAQQAIQAAIQARQQQGQQVPQLSQGATSSPQPGSQVNSATPQAIPAGMGQGQASQTPPPTDTQMILKAMDQKLRSISKVEEHQAGIVKAPAQSPQAAPVGGGMGGCGPKKYNY